MLTSLPSVDTNLAENGHPGYVIVTDRTGLAVGSVVSLASSGPSQSGLKVIALEGRKVSLWDPTTQTEFDASAFLVANGAHLVQDAQDVFGAMLRNFLLDDEDRDTPLATTELSDILAAILPGGAGAASNVTVLNFPAQQHVLVDNTVSVTQGTTQNTGSITAAAQNVSLPISGRAGVAIVITGTWSGTLAFEASGDAGTTWFGIEAFNPDATNELVTSSVTGNGTFQPLDLAGITHVRVRASAWSSGTADIYLSATGVQAERLAPNLRKSGAAAPTYGAVVAGLDGGSLAKFLRVATDGSVVLDQTGFTDGSHKTQVTNFPATQAISAAALPLPTGAATSAAQTDGSQKAQVVAGANVLGVDASGRIGVNVNGTVPVSAAALPLPTGAATEVTLAAVLAKLLASVAVTAAALPLPTGAATGAAQTDGSQKTGIVGHMAVDAVNSTSTPLAPGATFTGAFVDYLNYSTLLATIVVDQAGTLFIDESTDGVSFVTTTVPVAASASLQPMSHSIDVRYYRVRYTNGGVAQGTFRLQVLQSQNGFSGDGTGVGFPISSGMRAQLTKSVISGKQPVAEGNAYKEVSVDSRGAMLVAETGVHGAFGGLLSVNEVASATFKSNFGINARTARTTTANGGSVTWAASQTSLQTGAAANGSAKLATREAVRYVPGQGSIARFAPIFGTPATNSRQAVGFLTDTDGFGFGYNGTSFGILIRNNSVDTWIPQASWNGDDRFDGTGTTGVTLNPQRGMPMSIQFQWLGFGAVRWYIEDPNTGDFVLAHVLKFANSSTTPSILQPDLPVRFEVVNTGNTSNIVAKISSMGGYHEGDSETPGADVRFSFSNLVAGVPTGGARVFTLRNKATNIYGNTNVNTINVHFDHVGVRAASTGDMYVQLILNPTLTGASYADIATATSVMESDVASTYTPGTGTVLITIPVTSNTSESFEIKDYDIRLAPGDVLLARAVSETGTVNTRVSLSWHEET